MFLSKERSKEYNIHLFNYFSPRSSTEIESTVTTSIGNIEQQEERSDQNAVGFNIHGILISFVICLVNSVSVGLIATDALRDVGIISTIMTVSNLAIMIIVFVVLMVSIALIYTYIPTKVSKSYTLYCLHIQNQSLSSSNWTAAWKPMKSRAQVRTSNTSVKDCWRLINIILSWFEIDHTQIIPIFSRCGWLSQPSCWWLEL